jgi:SpoVK/Ycf46/Vps4 family AAA+-type ATPase
MDPAILRRFVMAVELPPLDEGRRAAVWVREAGEDLTREEATRLARRFEVSPASITGAIRAARLIGSGRVDGKVAEEVLAGNVAATGASPKAPPVSALRYEPGLLNASMDLDVLARRLEAAGPAAQATICLHGPPGTGKSEWVRHLAARLQRKVHVHAVSDIESKYVGESETNLARAFERADQEGALLLFDEADSFLLDRRSGERRWEISLTNEFLQRLEAARGIVACTTNAFDRLDPAVMRRFSIKVELGYLEVAAAVRLFAVAFEPLVGALDEVAMARVSARLADVGQLAPGDFATVARRADLLPEPLTVEVLVEELAQEVRARRGSQARVAGFRGG